MTTAELAAELRKGCEAAPNHPEALVNVRASQVLTVLDALDEASSHADELARQLAAVAPSTPE